jgi:hypothetical protein
MWKYKCHFAVQAELTVGDIGAFGGGWKRRSDSGNKELYREITWGLRGDSGPVLALRMKTLLSRERGTVTFFFFLLHVTCSHLHD